jgi:hypothetical protein
MFSQANGPDARPRLDVMPPVKVTITATAGTATATSPAVTRVRLIA